MKHAGNGQAICLVATVVGCVMVTLALYGWKDIVQPMLIVGCSLMVLGLVGNAVFALVRARQKEKQTEERIARLEEQLAKKK